MALLTRALLVAPLKKGLYSLKALLSKGGLLHIIIYGFCQAHKSEIWRVGEQKINATA